MKSAQRLTAEVDELARSATGKISRLETIGEQACVAFRVQVAAEVAKFERQLQQNQVLPAAIPRLLDAYLKHLLASSGQQDR